MKIHSIRIKNFISHRDTSIEFPQGLTVIIGRNGAGKTSILDAISYALFKEHGRGRDENLINRRANSAQIQLIFSSGGRKYEITWRIGRKKRALATLRNLTENSTIFIDAGERTAVPEIERIVGISRNIFTNAAYVKQGEIAKLLEVRPAERKETISKLLGIDVLEKIWENLKTPIGILEERYKRYVEEAKKLSELKEQLQINEEESSELERKRGALQKEQNELKSKLDEAQRKMRMIEGKRRKYEKIKELLAEVTRDLALKRRDLENKRKSLDLVSEAEKKLGKLGRIRDEYAALEEEIGRLERKREDLLERINRKKVLTEKLRGINENIRSLESLISEYVKKLESYSESEVGEDNFEEIFSATLMKYREIESRLKEKLQELTRKMGESEGRKNICMKNIEELESGSEVCPLCKRPLTASHRDRVLRDLRKELEELDDYIGEVRNEIEELKLEIREVESVIRELSKIDLELFTSSLNKCRKLREEGIRLEEELEKLRGIEEEFGEIVNLLTEKRKKLDDLREPLEEYERERGVIEKLGSPQIILTQIHRLSSELKELEEKKLELESQMETLGYRPEEYDELMAEVDRLHESLAEIKSKIASINQRIKSLEDERVRLREEYEEAKRAADKAEILERYLKTLKAIRECFGKDGVQRYIRAAARRSIEHYARDFLQFFTLTYSDLRLDEDYNVYVYGPMGEQSIDSLSGGEKTAIALCLRLGLAAALTGDQMECILMDEPTTHLDPERRRELIRLLANFRRERGLIPQAIIVTHDAEIEEAADQVYHLTLRDGYSHLEEVRTFEEAV